MSRFHYKERDPAPACHDETAYQRRVFASVWDERDRMLGALMDDQSGESWRIANRLASCCREPMILRDPAGSVLRLSERRCRSRCCPRCRRFRAREVQARLLEACRRMDSRRFLTLTLRSSDAPLADQLRHLRRSFARLRRHHLWKSRVTGGVYCVEVTYNPKRGQWHPHLHAIIDGEYVVKQALSDAWCEATGGSTIVDIRAVSSASRVASYVAKYVAKSDDGSKVPANRLAQWAAAIHGLRLVHSFGNLHGVALIEKPESIPGVSVEVLDPSVLAAADQAGDPVAGRILDAIERAAMGSPTEDHAATLSRLDAWSAWSRERDRKSRRIWRPPDPPPRTDLWA